jgi:omega-amidase
MDASYVAWGHSTIVDPMGQIVSTTDEAESIVFGVIDSAFIKKTRNSIPVYTQRRFDLYPNVSEELKR